MRIDQYAYQRATKVAGFGLLVQVGIGLILFIFARAFDPQDTPLEFAAWFTLIGSLVWLSLIVLFYQHKLERLEALEADELAGVREGQSIFEAEADEARAAARRLGWLHKWGMPIVSATVALVLALGGWRMVTWFRALDDPAPVDGSTSAQDLETVVEFTLTAHTGWAIAICLSLALVGFIVARFVAGMAKQPAWQNLRGGAGYMIGTAMVLLALSVGLTFRVFGEDEVIEWITRAIPWFMFVLAAEIAVNLLLNLYRPRVPGETPRPAFDSKLLSYFTAPDSLVRSVNEAVNYQFGFDVTSTWGYRLLLRSFAWLVALAVVTLVLLSTMVVVEPHQQAVRLRFGAIVGDTLEEAVHGPGVMFKWPWPVETAEVYDVARVRRLPLTAEVLRDEDRAYLWGDELRTKGELQPLIVRAAHATDIFGRSARAGSIEPDSLSGRYSLLDAEISLTYQIKPDGLLEYLHFTGDGYSRRQDRTDRQRVLRALAMQRISRHFAERTLTDVLTRDRAELSAALRRDIQATCDRLGTGVDVVSVDVPMVRPSGDAAEAFEELANSLQVRPQRLADVRRDYVRTMATYLGDETLADQVLAEIDAYDELRSRLGPDHEDTVAQRVVVEDLLREGGGWAAREIAQAETDRWIRVQEARAKAIRTHSQVQAYRAAPDLFKQREIMRVLTRTFAPIPKFVLGIDPSRVDVSVELRDLTPQFDFSSLVEEEANQ